MDLSALSDCLASASCAVTQLSTGLLTGMLLFLVAAGLSLIFGILGIVNFAHGAFYMLGAYFAFAGYEATGSFIVALVCGAFGMAIFGFVLERFFFSRVYGHDVLMQLLLCYAFVLILDDAVKIVWGADYKIMGMPSTFAVPPIFLFGGAIPVYYAFLIGVSALIGIVIWLVIGKTRFGKVVRAAAVNPQMVSALGINTKLVYGLVFASGSLIAGLAGALAAPVRTLTPGMGLSILIESFIVTVIGGMGSIGGTLIASILIGVTRSFGSVGLPLFVDGLMFLFMALVLITRPQGLFGRAG